MRNSVITISMVLTLITTACVQNQTQPKQTAVTPAPMPKEVPVLSKTEERKTSSRGMDLAEPAAEQEYSMSNFSSSGIVANRGFGAIRPAGAPTNREVYGETISNGVKQVAHEPVSTFSIDVDTGAYAVVRRHLNQGVLPPTDAVRIEELVNYFDYQYDSPDIAIAPFSVSTEIAATPWNANTHLVQVGLQGYLPDAESRSPANLVFLIDVSGSMKSTDKLPLLKKAFRMLVKQLDEQDKVSMVVYAGASGVVLESTKGDQNGTILAALDKLTAGGSTHGSAGIKLAYNMAQQGFIKDGINRVILATDGDFNVGTVNHQALLDLIERKKNTGISLTTLGFGSGNYNDHLMEQLADNGDGNYAYIDNLSEARKILVNQVSATLETIAKDVKIQIEWNPARVSEYRLIGYENRLLNREDFNNDKVDAGEIGAGHTVTALYEITLTNSAQQRIEPLRYQSEKIATKVDSKELAFVKLRYKKPGGDRSKLLQHALKANEIKQLSNTTDSLRFASSVAAFGELLRGGKNLENFSHENVLQLARSARGNDPHGYRGEFIRLVELAQSLGSNS